MYVFYIWFWKTATGGSQSLNFFFLPRFWGERSCPCNATAILSAAVGPNTQPFNWEAEIRPIESVSPAFIPAISFHFPLFVKNLITAVMSQSADLLRHAGSLNMNMWGWGSWQKELEMKNEHLSQLPPVALHQVERNGCTESAFCSAQERHEHSTPAALPEKWRALLAMFNITTNGALPCTSTQWLTTRRLNCAQILFPRLPAQNTIARRIQRFLNTNAQKNNNSVAQIARALPPERDDHRHDRATGARAVGRPVAYWRWKCGKQKPELSHG